MQIRIVQIWGFLMTVVGWVFVGCTMAMDDWMSSSIGGTGGSFIIKSMGYWASLWKTCQSDATSVNKCYDLPGLWSADVHLQAVRGLLAAALSLGMLGFLLSLLGMECTVIGGKDQSKSRKIYAGGICHIISGVLSTCAYAVYVDYVLQYFNPDLNELEYEPGSAVLIGWVGSAFHMAGGFFYLWSVCKPLCSKDDEVIQVQPLVDPEQAKSPAPDMTSRPNATSVSELSSKSLSSISVKSEHPYKAGQTAKSGYSQKTRRASRSSRSKSLSATWSSSQSSVYSESSGSIISASSRRSSRSSSSSSSNRTGSSLSE